MFSYDSPFTQRGFCSLSPEVAHQIQIGVHHQFRLGERSMAELLLQVVEQRADLSALLRLLENARRTSPVVVASQHGDRYPPKPIRQVA